MRIFGGILPFIGWRVVNVDNDGYPTDGRGHFKADAFQIEWFGFGAILFIGKVYQ
jgi:hypothetical protein